MDAQIVHTEKPQGAFIVYENVVVHKGGNTRN